MWIATVIWMLLLQYNVQHHWECRGTSCMRYCGIPAGSLQMLAHFMVVLPCRDPLASLDVCQTQGEGSGAQGVDGDAESVGGAVQWVLVGQEGGA
jgi:hypothetical protein